MTEFDKIYGTQNSSTPNDCFIFTSLGTRVKLKKRIINCYLNNFAGFFLSGVFRNFPVKSFLIPGLKNKLSI